VRLEEKYGRISRGEELNGIATGGDCSSFTV
jgi:hypothetical protein